MPTMNRRAAKRDLVEPAIIKALRAAGASVVQLSDRGLPDLLVAYTPVGSYKSITMLMEVKTGNAKLTAAEQEFFRQWPGRKHLIRTPQEALMNIEVPESDYHLYLD